MVVGDISHVLTGCSCLDSTTERWDSDHDARWFGTQRTQLGDKPYGCREGSFKESIGTYRDRQGEEMPSNLLILPCLIVSQVDGVLWDLERPLEGPCKLELLDFEHPEGAWFAFCCVSFSTWYALYAGKRVFWHSSAHVLGEASERHYGCHLCIGPPTDEGFFYEMAIEDR